jgi:hypothetical protein
VQFETLASDLDLDLDLDLDVIAAGRRIQRQVGSSWSDIGHMLNERYVHHQPPALHR